MNPKLLLIFKFVKVQASQLKKLCNIAKRSSSNLLLLLLVWTAKFQRNGWASKIGLLSVSPW